MLDWDTADIGIVDQEIHRFNAMLLKAHGYRIQEWGPGLTLAVAMSTLLTCIEKYNRVMLWVLIEVRDQLCHVHWGHVPKAVFLNVLASGLIEFLRI